MVAYGQDSESGSHKDGLDFDAVVSSQITSESVSSDGGDDSHSGTDHSKQPSVGDHTHEEDVSQIENDLDSGDSSGQNTDAESDEGSSGLDDLESGSDPELMKLAEPIGRLHFPKRQYTPNPSALSVCKEARAVALKRY